MAINPMLKAALKEGRVMRGMRGAQAARGTGVPDYGMRAVPGRAARAPSRPRVTGTPRGISAVAPRGLSARAPATPSITSGVNPAASWSAGYGSAAAVGGMLGAMTADPGQRLKGAALGAGGGMVAGKAFRSFSRKGANISNSVYAGIDSKIGANAQWGPMSRAWNKHKGVVHKGLRGFHSTEGRHNMFRSGAMLGGAGFGAMFASNGRSHKRGFNSRRGNSFSR